MFSIILCCIGGCLLGIFTGITPGIHVNTICLLGLASYDAIGLDSLGFAVAMVSMSITHTFIDFIPAIFLGIPEENTCLSVLPAHQLVLSGRGFEAVMLTGCGSLMGLFFSILMLPAAVITIPWAYSNLRGIIAYIVAGASCYLMIREKGFRGKLMSLAIFLMAGILGIICLGDGPISATYMLFPVFSGLFGISGILVSLGGQQNICWQKSYADIRFDKDMVLAGGIGSFGGLLVGILPAMSPSQIGIIMSGIYGKSPRSFLISVSAINTADAIYSLIALYSIGNPRSGVAVMIGKIMDLDLWLLLVMSAAFMICAPIAFYAHMALGKNAIRYFRRIDYGFICRIALALILGLIYAMTGFLGVFVSLTAAVIGILPIRAGVSRTHLMGVLIVPTLIYFMSRT